MGRFLGRNDRCKDGSDANVGKRWIINRDSYSEVDVHNALIDRFSPLAKVCGLSQRKIKREDNSGAFDLEEASFVVKPAKVEIGSGYAVAVGHDENDEAILDVKTYGIVDMARIHSELETLFPNTKIRHLAEKSSVAVVKKTKRKRK